MMKIFCILLFSSAVFAFSDARSPPKFREKISVRTPFYKRQRLFNPMIVGGSPARIEDFPYHLGLSDLRLGGFICGASAISPQFALTAAHCLNFGHAPNLISLWGGSTSRLTGGKNFFIEKYEIHPQYDEWTYDYDIAVMKMDPETLLQGFPNVSPIPISEECLTACCDVCPTGSITTIVGWGISDVETRQNAENLQQISKSIIAQNTCDVAWMSSGGVSERKFCTNVERGVDTCDGDSGGAIIRNGIQIGVVSFGSNVCGDETLPAVYTRIEDPSVRRFIREQTGI